SLRVEQLFARRHSLITLQSPQSVENFTFQIEKLPIQFAVGFVLSRRTECEESQDRHRAESVGAYSRLQLRQHGGPPPPLLRFAHFGHREQVAKLTVPDCTGSRCIAVYRTFRRSVARGTGFQ